MVIIMVLKMEDRKLDIISDSFVTTPIDQPSVPFMGV